MITIQSQFGGNPTKLSCPSGVPSPNSAVVRPSSSGPSHCHLTHSFRCLDPFILTDFSPCCVARFFPSPEYIYIPSRPNKLPFQSLSAGDSSCKVIFQSNMRPCHPLLSLRHTDSDHKRLRRRRLSISCHNVLQCPSDSCSPVNEAHTVPRLNCFIL